jgi:hypothetical protein
MSTNLPRWLVQCARHALLLGLTAACLQAAPAKGKATLPTASDDLLLLVDDGKETDARAKAMASRVQGVAISTKQLRLPAFTLNLGDGVRVRAERDTFTDLGNGDLVWSGRLQNEPLSRVTFAVRRGAVSGTIDRPLTEGNDLYEVQPMANGGHLLIKHDESKAPPRGPSRFVPWAGSQPRQAAPAARKPPVASEPIVIDLMMVYTPASRARYGQAGIESRILQAVADANTSFSNSQVNATYNLVYMGEIAYTETGDMGAALSSLQGTTDGQMDGVHALRDQYGADLVCLVNENANFCGISYVMTAVNTAFAQFAFSAVYSSCFSNLTLPHELGHTLGNQHDRANSSFQGAYPYSYGWRRCVTGGTGFRTIMSYSCTGGTRVNFFSNPRLTYLGNPLGVDATVDPANAADNSRSLSNTIPVAALFRNGPLVSPPTPPIGLAATAVSATQVNLTWTDTSNNETSFSLERSTDGVNYAVIATLAANATAYADNGAAGSTTYSYRLRAANSGGNSPYSNVATATTPAPPQPPAAPSNLVATGLDTQSIGLAWLDNSTDETGFTVERSPDGTTWSVLASLPANTTAYTDAGLNPGTTWSYRIRASNGVGSTLSNVATASTQLPPNPPAAPSDLAAAGTAFDQISLAWTDNSADETGFTIERSADGSAWSVLTTVAANTASYADAGLPVGSSWFYRVSAFNAAGSSAPTDVVGATTLIPTPPAAPTGLSAAGSSFTAITLAWTDNASDEDGYVIERSPDGSAWSQLAALAPNSNGYVDSGLVTGSTWSYRVRAFNEGGSSGFAGPVSATTLILLPPSPASVLTATAVTSARIDLAWNDNSSNESGFRVERSTDGVNYTLIATTGPNVRTFSNTLLSAATLYYYRIVAFNAAGNAAPSNVASATTPQSVPAAPSNLVGTAVSSSQINLSWTDNSTNESGFTVQRSTNNGATWTTVATVGPNVRTFNNSGLVRNTQYRYRVAAFNSAGTSAFSNQVNVRTLR